LLGGFFDAWAVKGLDYKEERKRGYKYARAISPRQDVLWNGGSHLRKKLKKRQSLKHLANKVGGQGVNPKKSRGTPLQGGKHDFTKKKKKTHSGCGGR